jgi:hypothetical protein
MIGPTDLLHPFPEPHFKTFQAFLICCPELGKTLKKISKPQLKTA